MERLLPLADELNVYADEALVRVARTAAEATGRGVTVSVFLSWEWDMWPADPAGELARWSDLGVDRACVSLGSDDMLTRIAALVP